MARRPLLDFEKPLVELEQQIEQIRQLEPAAPAVGDPGRPAS